MKVSLVIQYGILFVFMMYGSQFIRELVSMESIFLSALINGLAAGITIYLISRINALKSKILPVPVGILLCISLPIISIMLG